jgi:hypothetical protein
MWGIAVGFIAGTFVGACAMGWLLGPSRLGRDRSFEIEACTMWERSE